MVDLSVVASYNGKEASLFFWIVDPTNRKRITKGINHISYSVSTVLEVG